MADYGDEDTWAGASRPASMSTNMDDGSTGGATGHEDAPGPSAGSAPADRTSMGQASLSGLGARVGRGPRPPQSDRARRRNWILASITILIVVAGVSLVYRTYEFGDSDSQKTLPVGQPVKIYYSDGSTEMAQVGDESRTSVPLDKPTGHVVHNVMDELSKLRKTDRNIAKATAQDRVSLRPGRSRTAV
jgi:hypothetical protein